MSAVAEAPATAPAATPAVDNNPTVPEQVTVTRFITEENPAGQPFLFKKVKLRQKDKSKPARMALAPEKLKWDQDDAQQKVVKHLGLTLLIELAVTRWKAMAANWTASATKDGVFNEAEFQKYASEFSARGETIKSLLAEREDLIEEMIQVTTGQAGLTPDEIQKRVGEIGDRMKEIAETIDFKKRSNTEEVEEGD